jgi:polyisoprenoid-binding protein YceI
MVGPEVLDVERFQSITFESTAISRRRRFVDGRWLTIHGQTRA